MRNVQRLTIGGLMAALIMLFTLFLRIHTAVGYIHLGDSVIFLSAVLLGPYAALSAAVGSAMADLFGGSPLYILPTFFLKGLMGWLAGRFLRGSIIQRLLVFCLCESIMVLGYALFESLVYNWPTALAEIPMNCLQAAGGVAFGMLFCVLAERINQEVA